MKGDPWRYVCPACESHTIRKNTQAQAVEVNSGIHGRDVEYAAPYRCRYCQTDLDAVRDKKTGNLVQP
jgi:hypothetical protein